MDRLAADAARRSWPIWPGAVAVSGGGDSLALMHLLAGWAKARGQPAPLVLTVDHALRAGSAKDARQVVRWAKALGLKAHILTASGPRPASDIEAVARARRFSLLGAFLARRKIGALYLGHTRDDQAETFLLRLGRGSGLDGLAAMRPLAPFPQPGGAGPVLARPLLGHDRAALRAWLKRRRQDWLEDPMNVETRFARSKIRALADPLAAAGLTIARIADAADHLARAREALELVTEAVLARVARPLPDGGILLDPTALAAAPREVGLRALAGLLMGLGGAPYRPRFDALERLFDRMAEGTLGGGATLAGCRLGPAPKRQQVFGPATLVLVRESSRKGG